MGDIYTKIMIFGPLGQVEVEALVDTGATFTKISHRDAEKVGLALTRETLVQLADGSVMPRMMGFARVEIQGRNGIVPITIGSEDELALVGYTALEIVELKPNPTTRTLEPARSLEMSHGPTAEARGLVFGDGVLVANQFTPLLHGQELLP